MTIKGPYIVEAHGLNSNDSGYAEALQDWAAEVYRQRPTRQFMPNGEDAAEYWVVWFTDRGDAQGGGGPHNYWSYRLEETYYLKADRNQPQAGQFTVSVDMIGQLNIGHFEYEDIGKTLWHFPVTVIDSSVYVDDPKDPYDWDEAAPDGLPTAYIEWSNTTAGGTGRCPLNLSEKAGKWKFSGREFDFANMRITITPEAAPEYAAVYDLQIEARPKWEVVKARYRSPYFVDVTIGTDFGRTDDRWCIESASYVTGDKLAMLRDAEPWGTIDGVRNAVYTGSDADPEGEDGATYDYMVVVKVKTTEFARIFSGKQCHFVMHFNHIWNVANDNTVPATGDVKAEGTGNIAPAALTATVDDCSVSIKIDRTNNSDDYPDRYSSWPDAVIVAMDGSKFAGDIQYIDSDTGTLTFPYPPLDQYLTFEAVGFDRRGRYVSDVTTCGVTVHSGGRVVVDSVTGGQTAKIGLFNGTADAGAQVSTSTDGTTEQLSGRLLPSVFYGGSISRSVSISGVLADDDGEGFDAIPESGMCILRLPGGRRYALDAQVSTARDGRRSTSVSISGTEVDF